MVYHKYGFQAVGVIGPVSSVESPMYSPSAEATGPPPICMVGPVTVTVQLTDWPVGVVAEITVSPALIPNTKPPWSTDATAGLLERQVKVGTAWPVVEETFKIMAVPVERFAKIRFIERPAATEVPELPCAYAFTASAKLLAMVLILLLIHVTSCALSWKAVSINAWGIVGRYISISASL